MSDWIIDLRKRASPCKFKEEDRMIRDRVVAGVLCNLTRRELLEQKSLDLQQTMDICLAMESSREQLKPFQPEMTTPAERLGVDDDEESPETAQAFALAGRGGFPARRNMPKRNGNNTGWKLGFRESQPSDGQF